MNKIENLTQQSNYSEYLNTMTLSTMNSSKGLIPYYVAINCTGKGYKVLDVGCGSGVLLDAIHDICPEAQLYGIDLNSKSVELCRNKGYTVYHRSLRDLHLEEEHFDCIIFSSVLHEIVSYDELYPYETSLINDSLGLAYNLLNINGTCIIRDGVEGGLYTSRVTINFKEDDGLEWARKFFYDYPIKYQWQNKTFSDFTDNVRVFFPVALAKEFLYTYTWGESHWNREINEKFGILTLQGWKQVIHANNFSIITETVNSENYLQFLEKKVVINKEIREMFEAATATFVCRKIL
jgi:SAM-dependent methyltransferase